MRPGADQSRRGAKAPGPASWCPETAAAGTGEFADVYRSHYPELVRLAAFIVGDRPTGEDVVQDVFIRLHQRWDTLADHGNPLPYLRAAVINACRSAIRRQGLIRRHAREGSPCPPLSAEESVLLSVSHGIVKSTAARGLAALARVLREAR